MTAPGQGRVGVGGLQVAEVLHAFVRDEALPGSGIDEGTFWTGVEQILADFTPRNRDLLARRARLQEQLDAWHLAQGGFRADWSLAGNRSLTLQGDAYTARLGQRYTMPSLSPPYSQTSTRDAPLGGANVLARWAGSAGARGEFQLQAYFDRTTRDERPVAESRNTFDLDFQSRRRWGSRHAVVWGAGYRITSGDTTSVSPTPIVNEGMSSLESCATSLCRSLPAWISTMWSISFHGMRSPICADWLSAANSMERNMCTAAW